MLTSYLKVSSLSHAPLLIAFHLPPPRLLEVKRALGELIIDSESPPLSPRFGDNETPPPGQHHLGVSLEGGSGGSIFVDLELSSP